MPDGLFDDSVVVAGVIADGLRAEYCAFAGAGFGATPIS